MKLFNDDNVQEEHKIPIFAKMFYKAECPPNPIELFNVFLSAGEDQEDDGIHDKDFDFEIDAQEIYSGFMQLYGIDLVDTNLHWYKFIALLGGVFSADTALSRKISIRHSNDNDVKRKAALEKARKSVEIGNKLTGSEEALRKAIEMRLLNGESLDGVI